MPLSSSPIVGTIAMEPESVLSAADRLERPDDSTLAQLLASLARCASLNGSVAELADERPTRLVASARLSRLPPADGDSYHTIRADVARLVDELEDEYTLVMQR
jgi:hypothetical protein